MTREEAEIYARNMSYEDALFNLTQARAIPYRKATFIKVNELIQALSQESCPYSTKDGYCQYEDIAETIPTEKPMCDRNICISNEYNGIGCDECVVNKPQEPMREFTEEEAKAYSKALDKMYKPTGFNVFNDPCDKCRYKRTSICGNCKEYDEFEQEPCTDAVSREAVLSKKIYTETEEGWSGYTVNADYIEHLPSVTPKPTECDDAISRQTVLDRIRESVETYHNQYTTDMLNMWGLFTQFIKEMPSVKPQEPKTGHWLRTGEVDVYYDLPAYECSKCGQTSLENGDYCPNCGAKMVEPQESEDKE